MIEQLIKKFTSGFEITNHLVDSKEEGWFLQTTCSYNSKVIYVNRLDLLPLYDSMKKRMEEQE